MDTIIFDGGVAICKKAKPYRDSPDEEFPVESLAEFLNCDVELRPGTTLRHIWAYLEQDAEFFGRVFRQAMGGFPIEAYITQGQRPVTDNEEDEDPDNRMEILEVYWDADVWDDKFEVFASFHGRGKHKWINADGVQEIGECGYAVEYTPVNELLDYPLLLDPQFNIIDKENNYETMWSGTRAWTVYDLYYAILYEITFCGTPDDQVRRVAELDQRLAEAKDAVARGDVHPIEDLFEDDDGENT